MDKVALDTNIAIDFLNGDKVTVKRLSDFKTIYLPITVCGELLFGAKNSGAVNKNLKKHTSFIESCILLHSSFEAANEYASIRKRLKDIGRPIPENDIWIAALCSVNDLPLISRDKHFQHIEKLKLHPIN